MSSSHLVGSRCLDGGGCPHQTFRKVWEPAFAEGRRFREDWSHVEHIRDLLGTEAEGIKIFFGDSDVPIASCIIKEVSSFCAVADVEELKTGAKHNGLGEEGRQSAWLDDRSRRHLEGCEDLGNRRDPENSGCVRRYENPLSATALYWLLRNQVRTNVPYRSGGCNSDRTCLSDLIFQECQTQTGVSCKCRKSFQ